MFDKLVVSSNTRRQGRVARFLIVTSISYLGALTVAFAASIMASDPQLLDSGASAIKLAPAFIPPQPSPDTGAERPTRANTGSSPQNKPESPLIDFNPNQVIRDGPRGPIAPPTFGQIGTGSGDRPGPGGGGGSGDGPAIGFGVPDHVVAPPPAPDPPERRIPEKRAPVRVSQKVLQGNAIVRVTPPYPPLAKTARVSGSVVVEIIISPDGVVQSVRAVSGHPLLTPAAVEAAWGWRFQPTLLGDVPVSVTGLITFVFNL